MPTPGVDCHITLQHPSVAGGEAVGFICKADKRGPVLTLRRARLGLPLWADQGAGPTSAEVTVLGLPRQLAPNGADYGLAPADVRARLVDFWAQTTPLTLTHASGSWLVVWAGDGFEERRYGDGVEFDLRWRVTS